MCLAIPVCIRSIDGDSAVGEVGGVEREISIVMTPGVKTGDYVVVHAGFAIQVIDQQKARENLELFRAMARATDRARERASRQGRRR